jgi:hypothetical protein
MTIGSNNLMYEAREVLSAPRLNTLNAAPFLSVFLLKQFIHLKSTKTITYIILGLIIYFMPYNKKYS